MRSALLLYAFHFVELTCKLVLYRGNQGPRDKLSSMRSPRSSYTAEKRTREGPWERSRSSWFGSRFDAGSRSDPSILFVRSWHIRQHQNKDDPCPSSAQGTRQESRCWAWWAGERARNERPGGCGEGRLRRGWAKPLWVSRPRPFREHTEHCLDLDVITT